MSKDKDRGKFPRWLSKKLGRQRRTRPNLRDLNRKQLAELVGISLVFYRPLRYDGDPPTMDKKVIDKILTGLSTPPVHDPGNEPS